MPSRPRTMPPRSGKPREAFSVATRPQGAAVHAPARRPARRPRRRGAPRVLYLYMASEILQVFAVAMLAIVLVYLTVVAFQLVRDGIRLSFVWPHLIRTLAYPLFFAIPLALLMGVTLGVGRMANDHELSALRAQGVSHLQLFAPIAALGLGLAALTFYLTGWLLPDVHYEQANLRDTILDQLKHLGSGSNRTILLPGNVSLWVKRYQGTQLQGIILDVPRGDRAELLPKIGEMAGEMVRRRLAGHAGKVTLVAREANLEVSPDRTLVILGLAGVDIQLPEEVTSPRGRDVFHQQLSIDKLRLPISFARRGESAKDMTNPELGAWIGTLRGRVRALREEIQKSGPSADLRAELLAAQRRAARASVEYHGRLTFSLACLTFPWVAFPLVVALERWGRLTHFFLGNLLVVTTFFPLVMAGGVAADRGVPAALAMAFPNAALAVLGGWLTRLMAAR